LIIREAKPETDWLTGIWPIFREVVRAGDTYAFAPDMDEASAREQWLLPAPAGVFVAVNEQDGAIVGTSLLKANQPALGAHVANAAFMVATDAAGHGVGRALAEHAIEWARQANFSAMQFNFVVSTNSRAIALWKESRLFDRGDSPTSLSASGARSESRCLCDAPLSLTRVCDSRLAGPSS
jgi:GNAT superfamily N-acetyltransferase